jgi:hypothetical protein
MLSGDELFVVLKLVSGEQVMAVLRSEDDDYIEIESPMCIRTIPVLEQNREHITAHPLCQFSDDVNYVLDKKDVMFVKKMHHIFIPHYLRIVKEHEELVDDNEQKSAPRAEDLYWEEEQEIDLRNFVEGNDTIN